MKKTRLVLSTILAVMLAFGLLSGCSACGSREPIEGDAEDSEFTYSMYIDDNGHWEDITATELVTLFDYDGLEIPAEVHEISDEAIDEQVTSILSSSTSTQVVDRAAQDGDTLNIDFVGTVDGVEFEGGNTGGAGTEVTIGVTNYIEGFLEQLIGHSAGEVFDINVTFPKNYNNTEVAGKDAVFNITINSVSETVEPELSDEFVAQNLSQTYGWTTIEEMREGLFENLQSDAIMGYVQDYLAGEVEVNSIPEKILEYQEKAFVAYYESMAEMYGVELEEFITTYMNAEDMDTLLANSQEDIRKNAVYSLVVQAVAEDAGIEVTEDDLSSYFEENMGSADYSSYEEEYGLPYLKQMVMGQLVINRIIDNVVLA